MVVDTYYNIFSVKFYWCHTLIEDLRCVRTSILLLLSGVLVKDPRTGH